MKTLSAWLLITILPLILVSQVIAGDWDKIKIATEGDYPPWNFVDGSDNLVGFEIELAKKLCPRMNAACGIIPQKRNAADRRRGIAVAFYIGCAWNDWRACQAVQSMAGI